MVESNKQMAFYSRDGSIYAGELCNMRYASSIAASYSFERGNQFSR